MIKNDLTDLQAPQSKLNGIFRGIIEDNNDPLKAGRCRVRVFGVHTAVKIKTETDGIPTDELPWAEPALSLIEGAVSNYGVWGVPLQGSHVFLFFENGNILNPRFFASAPGIPTSEPVTTEGFNDPDGVYPDKLDSPDYYEGGVGSEYPECISLITHGGHRIEIDNTPNNKRILIFHRRGSYVEVDNAGNIVVHAFSDGSEGSYLPAKWGENIQWDKNVKVGGDYDIVVDGACSEGGGNMNITLEHDKTLTINGEYTIDVNGGDYNLTVSGDCSIVASGAVNVTGSPINLN